MTYADAVREAASLASACPNTETVVVEHRWTTDNESGELHYEAMPIAAWIKGLPTPPPVNGCYTEHEMRVVLALRRPEPGVTRTLVAGRMLPLHPALP